MSRAGPTVLAQVDETALSNYAPSIVDFQDDSLEFERNQDPSDKVLIWIRVPPPEVALTPDELENYLGDPERPVVMVKRIMLIPDPKGTETLIVEDFPMPRGGRPESVSIVGEDGVREVLEWHHVAASFGAQIHFRVGAWAPFPN